MGNDKEQLIYAQYNCNYYLQTLMMEFYSSSSSFMWWWMCMASTACNLVGIIKVDVLWTISSSSLHFMAYSLYYYILIVVVVAI